MKPQSPDTHPEIERILIEGYRKMAPWEKLASVAAMNNAARSLQVAQIRKQHPHAGEHEVRMRLASRWLPADLMRRAFGWDPDKEGY
jgi:hypothetical protein